MGRRSVVDIDKKREIYQRFRSGETQEEIAKSEGVTQASISRWIAHVEKEFEKPTTKPKSGHSPKPSKPKGPPKYFKDLEKVVRTQTEEIRQLKEKVAILEGVRVPVQHSRKSPSPRRAQVIETLSDGSLLTYEEIAERIGTSPTRVKNAINGAPEGLFQKFRGFERRGARNVERVRVRLA